ncbi:MAG: shikimate dehydrogenase [Solirubrobacteraceae bacterium]
MLNRLGVLGWPVAHSLSPRIQNAALHVAGLPDWHYQLLPVPPELFVETVAGLPEAGFRGANVTIPHKQAALALATHASPRAAAIGAANTLIFMAGAEVRADNTDARALIASLPHPPVGASVLVLGAGGSARAAVWALRDAGAASVRIWNRTGERAQRVADELGAAAVTTAQVRSDPGADLLVNCTAVGLRGPASLDGLPIGEPELDGFGCVVDLVYRPEATALIAAARTRGIAVVDGLEILVGQAALSFELFTGRPASVAAMRVAAGSPATADGGYIQADERSA